MGILVIAGFFMPWLVSEDIPEERGPITGRSFVTGLENEVSENQFGDNLVGILLGLPYLVLVGGTLLILSSILSFLRRQGLSRILLIFGAISLGIGVFFPAGVMLIVVNVSEEAEELSWGAGIGLYMSIFGYIAGAIAVYLSGGEEEEVSEKPTKSIARCPNCGAELEPDSKYCTECGTAVEERN